MGVNHTKGPWKSDDEDFLGEELFVSPDPVCGASNDYESICICVGPDRRENAKLIAAAPDLLGALEHIVNTYDNWSDIGAGDIAVAVRAIKKAGATI